MSDLPDLFRFASGERVTNEASWLRRRQELRDLILEIEYGRLPPTPAWVRGEELHSHTVPRLGDARHTQYRLVTGPPTPAQFRLDLLSPPGVGPFPVVLSGDGWWRYATDEVARQVVTRGYILAEFSRVEIVPDVDGAGPRHRAATGLYRACPEGDFGALSAWAWGYHRAIDFLVTLASVDATRIAVTGHSRGGKTALLAGATDERIALTNPNDSGCAGAGCFRIQGPGSETLEDIVRRFPHWFGPRLEEYIGREDALPFDQHSLKALVAPRALLSTEALGDLWANPWGTWHTHAAARELYTFLGAPERIGIWYRQGVHEHSLADWTALLDFADWQLLGKPPADRFDRNPF